MATYTYSDSFIVDSIDTADIDDAELKAIEEVTKLNITDTFYIEKAVIAKVYMILATVQLDNEGMSDRLKAYSNEFKHYTSLAKNNSSSSNVSTMPIARG